MKKYIFTLALSMIASFSEAHNGNDGFVTISNFQLWSNTYNNPQIRVVISGDTYYNPSKCINPDSYMVSTALSEKIQDRMYSNLLSAVMANKSVVLRVENNGCENDRPRIITVIIQ
jgi:hypothetical protein